MDMATVVAATMVARERMVMEVVRGTRVAAATRDAMAATRDAMAATRDRESTAPDRELTVPDQEVTTLDREVTNDARSRVDDTKVRGDATVDQKAMQWRPTIGEVAACGKQRPVGHNGLREYNIGRNSPDLDFPVRVRIDKTNNHAIE
ncbi:hypothetical protein VIGAN_01165900 [Vigna angularis var. angularis]|uniref:Uncharacterized protein n=1 Tax=Vigna angularis var. angularis TaxID=157739 RepID=A0A0S3R0F6_PHAAN|nr:hypothetical protein VIGAN_01165900 [Vigna angularis var. angularis]